MNKLIYLKKKNLKKKRQKQSGGDFRKYKDDISDPLDSLFMVIHNLYDNFSFYENLYHQDDLPQGNYQVVMIRLFLMVKNDQRTFKILNVSDGLGDVSDFIKR